MLANSLHDNLLVCARRPFALFVFSNVPICGILTRCSITPFRPRISTLASHSPSSSPVRRVCLKVSMLSRENRTAGVLELLRAYIKAYQIPGSVTASVSVSVGGVLPVCPLRGSRVHGFFMVHGPAGLAPVRHLRGPRSAGLAPAATCARPQCPQGFWPAVFPWC